MKDHKCWLVIVVLLSLLFVATVSGLRRAEYPCGHFTWHIWGLNRISHNCRDIEMTGFLELLKVSQEEYRSKHGQYAHRLAVFDEDSLSTTGPTTLAEAGCEIFSHDYRTGWFAVAHSIRPGYMMMVSNSEAPRRLTEQEAERLIADVPRDSSQDR